MDAGDDPDVDVSRIAAAIGDPGRARILFCLMDGHARTSTELSAVADVGPSTASAHLNRLKATGLVHVLAQGRHRYFSLAGTEVAAALESLSVLAGGTRNAFAATTPSRLRLARTCYDHLAGAVGVSIHDGLKERGWLLSGPLDYELAPDGARALNSLGVDIDTARRLRRRFAFGCLDWSERRSHLAGALGMAVLKLALQKKWVLQDSDSRALCVTKAGRYELKARFGAQF